MGASDAEMKEAEAGTTSNRGMTCPNCGVTTSMSALRHDSVVGGKTVYNIRKWNENEFVPRETDLFQERLYAIKYERPDGTRYYRAPTSRDLKNEAAVETFIGEHFEEWQKKGYIPTSPVESGDKTDEVRNNRGWVYWHQLYNPRQLMVIGKFVEATLSLAETREQLVAGILGIHRLANFNAKPSRFNPGAGVEKVVDVFFNQAISPLNNYGTLGMASVLSCWKF